MEKIIRRGFSVDEVEQKLVEFPEFSNDATQNLLGVLRTYEQEKNQNPTSTEAEQTQESPFFDLIHM